MAAKVGLGQVADLSASPLHPEKLFEEKRNKPPVCFLQKL